MKLKSFLMVTHCVASLIGSVSVFGLSFINSTAALTAAFFIPILLVLPVSIVASKRITNGILNLEKAVATGNDIHLRKTDIMEIDFASQQIRKYAQRWAVAAERSRSKSQEVDWLIEKLDSRKKNDSGSEVRLSQLLGRFASSAESNLEKIDELLQEFQGSFKLQTNAFEDQSDSISKTTTYVEQMSIHITEIPECVSLAQQENTDLLSSASSANTQLKTMTKTIQSVHSDVESNEFRLRALADHYREIGAIAETIGEISARTDMLALNVSLEAVRAGQNARSFTVLAEEVRKLSEQTAQAAREVSGLVESIQFKTQESLSGVFEQKSKLSLADQHSGELLQSLSMICDSAKTTGKKLSALSQTTGQQIKLTHDLIGNVERLSETSRDGRRRLESASWGIGNLTHASNELKQLLNPFRDSVMNQPVESSPPEVALEAIPNSPVTNGSEAILV